MRILHMCSYFLGNNLYRQFSKTQRARGIEAVWYVPTELSEYEECDSNIYVSQCYQKVDRINFFRKQSKIYNDLNKNFEVEDYDLIHAHSLFTNGYAAMNIFKEKGIPYIVAVRNTDLNVFFKYMVHLRHIGVEILLNAKKVIFLSESYKETLISKYISEEYKKSISKKTVIIPNGIDKFWLENIIDKTERKEFSNCINIITAGTVEKNKNQLTAARACKILKKQGIEVRYTVAGGINNNRIIKKLKKYDFFYYVGKLNKEELLKEYRRNDIFLLPSITETFGLVYAEAMTQGLPLIYSKGEGFDRQFPEGQVGYHVDCNNEREIADRIIDIVNKYSSISQNCKKAAVKFDWDKIVEQYEKIYAQILI